MVMVVVWEWAAEDQPTNVASANAALLQTAARAKRDMLDPPSYTFLWTGSGHQAHQPSSEFSASGARRRLLGQLLAQLHSNKRMGF
jgi:hypothetical protein